MTAAIMPAFAAAGGDDPLTVVSNLSDFIFSLIRAVGLILLGCGIFQVGLSLRQLIFALLAVVVAVGVYFGLRNVVGTGEVGWMCVLAAFPFALGGFFTYNGMTFEQFLLAFIRDQLLYPKKLVFRSENLYAKALENSSVKEALKID